MARVAPRPRAESGILHGTPRVFGRSVLGAPLEVWPGGARSSGVLVMGGVHGEEGEGVTLLSTALRALPEGALRCDVVLGLNPDGLARGTRGNARGVDLNRNLPASNWRGEPVPYRRTLEEPRDVVLSPGAHAGSEPETHAFLALVEQRTPRLIVSVHAPLACIDDPADTEIGRWLAERTGLAHVSDVGYPTPGSLGSWGAEQGIPIVTWELEREAPEILVRRHLNTAQALLAGEIPAEDDA